MGQLLCVFGKGEAWGMRFVGHVVGAEQIAISHEEHLTDVLQSSAALCALPDTRGAANRMLQGWEGQQSRWESSLTVLQITQGVQMQLRTPLALQRCKSVLWQGLNVL